MKRTGRNVFSVLIDCGLPIISLLIEKGADVNLRDRNKMRALDLAELLGSPELKDLLEKHTDSVQDSAKEEATATQQVNLLLFT